MKIPEKKCYIRKGTLCMRLLYTIPVMLVFFGCSSGEKTKSSKVNYVFEGLVSQAKETGYPFVMNSTGDPVDANEMHEIKLAKYKAFLPAVSQNFLYKKCFVTDSIVCLIFMQPGDIYFPRMMVYNKSTGQKLDSLNLFQSGGIDPGYYRSNRMTLNKDRTLDYYDSTWQSQTDENSLPIAGTERITIIKKKIRISEEGHVVMIWEKNFVR
jgi:hypothetical protein